MYNILYAVLIFHVITFASDGSSNGYRSEATVQ